MAVLWLDEIGADDLESVGGKAASLGELTAAGLPVPPGFVVTAGTYRRFIEETGIDEELFEAVDVDAEDSKALAEAEAERARLELEQTEIRAPFAGYVSEIEVAPGELTGADPLLRLIDVSVLEAEMVFVDGALGEIAEGDRVRLAVDLTGAEVAAEVTAIDPFVDSASNTFTVVAEVENADRALPSGVSCRVVAWPE